VHQSRHARRWKARISVALVTLAASATVLPIPAGAATNPITAASVAPLALNAPVVGMAATPSGKGAWRVGSDGGIFTSGDAHFYGSTGGMHLNQPIVGIAATPTGRGYWFVASDGGVFTFGNARFHGSTGGMHLNQPIVGMAATRSGRGYWLIARDGGVFSFGDARFHGSTGGGFILQPIVGMAAAPDGRGYLLLAANGSVFKFGSAAYYGSAAGACRTSSAVAIATARNARGYWIGFANGQAFALSPVKPAPRCPAAQSPTGGATADLYRRLNDERRARGLSPLAWNSTLATYAANWSRTMASTGMHHSDIGSLLNAFDYVGENIATGNGSPVSSLHVAWMRSQAHRDNILSPGFQAVGIGVYCAPDGSMWATTDFGRPWSAGQPPPYAGNTPPDPVARPDGNNITC
jgi:uncharacterized protein YkwD